MGGTYFYIDKKTKLAVASKDFDASGGSHDPKYKNGQYDIVAIGDNTDPYLSYQGGQYVWDDAAAGRYNAGVVKPYLKYSGQIETYNTINKNKDKSFDPELPDIFSLDESKYEDLYSLRDAIATEQNKKVDEINLIEDPIKKQNKTNSDLPFYDESYNYVNQKISDFESKIPEARKRQEIPKVSKFDPSNDKNSIYATPEILEYDAGISKNQSQFNALLPQYDTEQAEYVDLLGRSYTSNSRWRTGGAQLAAVGKNLAATSSSINQLKNNTNDLIAKRKSAVSNIDVELESKRQSRQYLLDPDLPELGNYNDNSSYDDLMGLKGIVSSERDKKISELNLIQDPIERYVAKEQELPQYDNYLNFANEKLVKAPRKDKDLPELSMFNDNTDYDKLYNFQDTIISEQNKKLEELNLIQDPVERFLAKEKELPQYDNYLNFANEKITNLDTRVANVRKTRTPNLSFGEIGDSFTYNDLIDSRNDIALLQNNKVNEINLIQDPAERYVAIEQDFPLFSNKLNEYDEKINQYGNILETRNPIDINFQRDRRGTLAINVGNDHGKFRNTRRGLRDAENFYAKSKDNYMKNLSSDSVIKNATLEQDTPFLNYNEKVIKQQKKIQKNQERQRLLNMGDQYAGDFGPSAPSDTPSGTIRVPTPPPNIIASSGLENIFGGNNNNNFSSFGEKQNKRMPKNIMSPDMSNSFDNPSPRYKEPKFRDYAKQAKEPDYSSQGYDFNPKPNRRRKNKANDFF
jgi:hypothetical protein